MELHYFIEGHGPLVVFIHAGVADSRMWATAVTATSGAGWRALAYDRRGFGHTPASTCTYTEVDDLLAILAGVEAEAPVVLVGCSQGGRIAIDTALAHPGRVRAMVLISPAVSGAPWPMELPAPIQCQLDAISAADAAGDLTAVNELEARCWLDGPLGVPGRVDGAARTLFLAMNAQALAGQGAVQPTEPPAAWHRLGELQVPVLIGCGDLDFPHIQDRCRMMGTVIGRAQLVVWPGAAHLPSVEVSARVDAALLAFLASLSP